MFSHYFLVQTKLDTHLTKKLFRRHTLNTRMKMRPSEIIYTNHNTFQWWQKISNDCYNKQLAYTKIHTYKKYSQMNLNIVAIKILLFPWFFFWVISLVAHGRFFFSYIVFYWPSCFPVSFFLSQLQVSFYVLIPILPNEQIKQDKRFGQDFLIQKNVIDILIYTYMYST